MHRRAQQWIAARSGLAVFALLTMVLGPLVPRPPAALAAPVPAPLAATTWYTETVDPGGGLGQFASLAIDASDHLHVSYYDAPNTALRYASFDGTTWAPITVDNSGSVGQYSSLDLDGSGNPHISYYESESGLRHAATGRVDVVKRTGGLQQRRGRVQLPGR